MYTSVAIKMSMSMSCTHCMQHTWSTSSGNVMEHVFEDLLDHFSIVRQNPRHSSGTVWSNI